jgi:hypothetical protein
MILRRIVVVVVALLVAGCQPGGGGLFAPEVVSGNERYVVVHDVIGMPGGAQNTAATYCKGFGRIAQYQSKGGDDWQCSGRSANLCTTYACVQ